MTEAKKDTAEPAKNPPTGPQSTKPVAPSATAIKDPDEAPRNAPSDNTPPATPVPVSQPSAAKTEINPEQAAELSKSEEVELERLLDGDSDESPASLAGDAPEDFGQVRNILKRLILVVPETTPDSHTVWGAGGVVLTLGHLRTLVKYMG